MRNKEIHIFVGHFGSGKTEIALNYALWKKQSAQDIEIIDLDIVNPYFRTNDASKMLLKNGIKLIANNFASSNIDMPIVSPEILGVFDNDSVTIFDVGGDGEGAYALGQYKSYFDSIGYNMHLVVNTKRLLTKTYLEMLEIAKQIEYASRLKCTDIYNNTNLADKTKEDTLLSDYKEIEKLSEVLNIPISKNCGIKRALSHLSEDMNKFEMEINISMPWQTNK